MIGLSLPSAQPRRPAQLTLAAQEDARHLVAGQDELDVPIELEPDIVANPIPESLEARAPRQEIAEAVEIHGPHHDTKPALDVADPLADDRVLAEYAAEPRCATQRGSLVLWQREPAHLELIDACGQSEEALQDRREALGVLRAPRQMRDEEPLGMIGHRVAIARAGEPVPGQRSDVHGEPVLAGSVLVNGRARLGPRAVEEEPEPGPAALLLEGRERRRRERD